MSNTHLIHPTALIDPKASLGKHVSVGPYTVISSNVEVGDNTIIEPHCILKGKTKIGAYNHIGSHTTIGFSPQFPPDQIQEMIASGKNIEGEVIIGNFNHIREYVSIHTGSSIGTGVTEIGEKNFIMGYTHIGHDVKIQNSCILSGNTIIGGHVEMGSFIVTGAGSAFHQFCKIGDYAMTGGMSGIVKDVAPFLLANGQRATLSGINIVGLKRNQFTKQEIKEIKKMYQIFFRQSLLQQQAISKIDTEIPEGRVKNIFLNFVKQSHRGLIR